MQIHGTPPTYLKQHLTDDGLLMAANGPDDYDVVDYIPDSYVDEQGIRHAVIFTEGLDDYMRLLKIDGKWELVDDAPF